MTLEINWARRENKISESKKAEDTLKEVKRRRYSRNKKYKLVKIRDHPLTYIEVEVKDEE